MHVQMRKYNKLKKILNLEGSGKFWKSVSPKATLWGIVLDNNFMEKNLRRIFEIT